MWICYNRYISKNVLIYTDISRHIYRYKYTDISLPSLLPAPLLWVFCIRSRLIILGMIGDLNCGLDGTWQRIVVLSVSYVAMSMFDASLSTTILKQWENFYLIFCRKLLLNPYSFLLIFGGQSSGDSPGNSCGWVCIEYG